MNKINLIIHKPLSDSDLKSILGSETKIITYPELSKYNNINELLPNSYDFVIILLLETPASGHWTALLKYNNGFEFFDSYGNAPDVDLTKWLTPQERLKLGESQKYLSFLLQGQPYIYNKVKYQIMKRGINTCGSHVAYRCFLFKKKQFNLLDYQKHVKNYTHLYGLTPDQLVATFVSNHL
jgi:hypothetical protein